MQRFTLAVHGTGAVKKQPLAEGVACYLFHNRSEAMRCAQDDRNSDTEVVEVVNLRQWLSNQFLAGISVVIEANGGVTRILRVETLIDSLG